MLAQHDAPIIAVATAPGRGAVGIVRVSGKNLNALVFVDWVAKSFEGRLKEEYQRGYEDCLTKESK